MLTHTNLLFIPLEFPLPIGEVNHPIIIVVSPDSLGTEEFSVTNDVFPKALETGPEIGNRT